MSACAHDSGSATGCRPLCDAPAVWAVTHHNGSLGTLTALVCDQHRRVTEARAYPGHDGTARIGASVWCAGHCGARVFPPVVQCSTCARALIDS